MREEQRVLEHVAHAPRLGREVDAARRVEERAPADHDAPRSGLTMPAIACTSVVLPEPERPKSATIGASLANAASSAEGAAARRRRRPQAWRVSGGACAAHEPFGERERGERERHREERQAQRLVVAAGHLGEGVDRERQRLRLAGDVGDERDGGAELAQRAREAEQRAGDHARAARAAA